MRHSLLVACLPVLVVCGDKSSDDEDGGSEGDGGGADQGGNSGWGDDGGNGSNGDGGGSSDVTCDASFSWYQKDAYAEEAGRSSDLWPPHTTTVIEYTCDDYESWTYVSQPNHGTDIDAVDEAGNWILDLVSWSDTVTVSESELIELTDAYAACDCEASTDFLSLDALEDSAVQAVVEALVGLVLDNLECSGETDAETLVYYLQAGELGLVLEALPYCTWDGGYDWQSALSEAFATVAAETGDALADFHVCNNDAMVQWEMFSEFVATGELAGCEAAQSLCHGPEFFYVVD